MLHIELEPFVGTMSELKEFFLKKWCRNFFKDESKWNLVGYSLLNDIRVRGINSLHEYVLWAGTSGCNFMMVDKTGGCHNFLDKDKNIYEVIINNNENIGK